MRLIFTDLERRLPEKLGQALPGAEGQIRMSPRPRFGWRPGQLPRDGRDSGVLLLLFPVSGSPHLVLTVRDPELLHHPGQVSLPGGAVEPGESIEHAALREAHEEVGLDPSVTRIVGALTPLHVPVSGYVLHPRVALTGERPSLRADQREVARIIETPLAGLVDPAGVAVETRQFGRRPVEVPYFAVEGEKVWGATAMVLSELLCVLDSTPNPWGDGGTIRDD